MPVLGAAAASTTTLIAKLRGSALIKSMFVETVMASPITVSENAASAISSGVTRDATSTKLRVSGAPITMVQSPYLRPRDAARVDGTEATQAGTGPARVDFMWQGQVLEIACKASGTYPYRIWKDGQIVATAMASGPVSMTQTNAASFIRCDFGSRLAKPAHIVFEFSNGFFFGGIVHEPTAYIGPPQIPSPRVFFVGDSFAHGNGATDLVMSYPVLTGRALGWMDTWSFSCVPSTGLVTTDSNVHKTGANRIPIDVTPYSPDVVIIQGSINDVAAAGAGTIGTALAASITAIKTANPNVFIVVTSPLYMASSSGSQSSWESIAAEMSTTCTTAGVTFLDLITGNPYFYGTGRVGTTTGDGPADFYRYSDGTHPSQDGHRAIALLLARLIGDKLSLATA